MGIEKLYRYHNYVQIFPRTFLLSNPFQKESVKRLSRHFISFIILITSLWILYIQYVKKQTFHTFSTLTYDNYIFI